MVSKALAVSLCMRRIMILTMRFCPSVRRFGRSWFETVLQNPQADGLTMFETRMNALRHRLGKDGIDVAVITDDDNIYYLTGYYDYLHMEFGRPTILMVHRDAPSVLITPTIDLNTAEAAARVDRIAPWNDGMGAEWRAELPALINIAKRVAIEPDHIPSVVRRYIRAVSYTHLRAHET